MHIKVRNRENEKILTVSIIKEEFGIKPALTYHWIRCRKFPIIKIDKKVLIPRASFQSFLDSHLILGGEK